MQTFTTARLTDKQVLDLLDDLIGHNSGGSCSVAIAGLGAAYPDKINRDDFKKRGSHVISAAAFTSTDQTVTIEFRRGLAKEEKAFSSDRVPSAHFDQVQLKTHRANQNTSNVVLPDRTAVHAFSNIIERHIILAEPSLASEPADAASNVLAQTLAKLNERFSELNAEADARRIEVEREIEDKRKKYETELAERERAFEARKAELEEAHAARIGELDDLQKTLDDRDHMHARRGLREAITQDIQEKLAKALLPRTSLMYRLAVLATVLVGAGFSGQFALMSYGDFSTALAQMNSAEAEPSWTQVISVWLLFGKGTIGSVAAFGFLVYAINWLRKSYSDDLRAHRDLERYAIDLNRASWAIETILEANSKEGVVIPDVMIEGVSRNLFGSHEPQADGKADAIAELLRASARAKIGPGGAEFELGRRGASKLAGHLD